MNELQTFKFENNEIRTVLKDNEPWFCLKDVCNSLDLTNPSVVIDRLNGNGRTKYNLGRQGNT